MKAHYLRSSYREKLIEHLFVGELLRLSWLKGDYNLEISKPEVDASGYDIIAEANGIIRHIQLKTSLKGSSTSNQKVHLALSGKPSGCVIWIFFNKQLNLIEFLFFGGRPNEPLPDISGFKIAKHTKGNAQGKKAERPNLRVINKGQFTKYDSLDKLYENLFFGA
jgi:hypothetical protein